VLTTTDPAQIKAAVHDSIRAILTERGEAAREFDAATYLNAQLGLSSLDLAVLVVELEATLGLDPFANLVPVTSVRSVGDVVDAYRLAASGARAAVDDSLAAAAERAQRRRDRRRGQD
jgi:acyl carrier protein